MNKSTVSQLIDHRGNVLFSVGDKVENDDAVFYIAEINPSQKMCHLDKNRPWHVKNPASPFAAAIKQGNYSASADTLRQAQDGNTTICHACDGTGEMDNSSGGKSVCHKCDGEGVHAV